MPVYLVLEQDNAKDEERYNKYQRLVAEEVWPWMQNMMKEGVKITSLADNTGHMTGFFEFENFEALGKMWNDPKWNSMMIKYSQLVDNYRLRLCRSGRPIEPEEVA